jgi:hypothetical protein
MSETLSPHILVGCPTCDLKEDSLEKYIQGLSALTYPHFDVVIEDNSTTPGYSEKIRVLGKEWEKNHPGHSFRVVYSGHLFPRARQRIVHGRNLLREMAWKEKYDYFFSLEQDIVPPPGIIEKLLTHQKDVVGGIYYNRVNLGGKERKTPVLMVYPDNESKKKNVAHWVGFTYLFPSRLVEVACIGLGCVLIHRNILNQFSFRVVDNDVAFDDMHFSIDLKEKNIPIFADTSLMCAHHYNESFKTIPDEKY